MALECIVPQTSVKTQDNSAVGRTTPTLQAPSPEQKSQLVNVGLFALSRGEWQIVMAITTLIQRKGVAYA
jgi:hypothetical protein